MEGKKLQEILRKYGVKQVELAKLLGVTEQTVSAMMRAASVKSTTLQKIADEFGIDITEFFSGGEVSALKKEIDLLKEKIDQLESQLKSKDETIQKLVEIIDKKII